MVPVHQLRTTGNAFLHSNRQLLQDACLSLTTHRPDAQNNKDKPFSPKPNTYVLTSPLVGIDNPKNTALYPELYLSAITSSN